uniref:G-protein coupled receptors family 1 profile domain-containing protein n=1 Tax=Sus scrofa TaxID=9823 RepID=A0A8D0NW77_PIG
VSVFGFMQLENGTLASQFLLEGLTDTQESGHLLFAIFLLLYRVAVAGNLGIASLTVMDFRLHTPMYFFLANLPLLDTAQTANTVPGILVHLLAPVRTMPYRACLTQIFFLHFLAPWECFLLTAMAYDHYAAICQPLPTEASWFCGPRLITHFFFLRIHPAEGRRRAFFTCGAPVTLVCISASRRSSGLRDRVLSALYMGLTPAFRPIIYSVRNKEVERALFKVLGKESAS